MTNDRPRKCHRLYLAETLSFVVRPSSNASGIISTRQERPRPQTGRDQTAVATDEPQPSLLREVAFEHRRAIDEDLTQRLPPLYVPG